MRHHPPMTAGHLEVAPPARLFASAFARRLTGTLTLRRGRFEKRIAFHDGRIVGAGSNQPSESLGTLLVCQGWIDVSAYTRSLAAMNDGGRRHGEVLVAQGALGRGQLAQALRLQALVRLCDAVTWGRGTYAFAPGPVPPHGRPYPLWGVLCSGMFQRHGRARLVELGRAHGDEVCRRQPSVLTPALLGLAEPFAVLGRADGARTVADVVRAGGDQLRTFATLLVLRQLGVVAFAVQNKAAPQGRFVVSPGGAEMAPALTSSPASS